MIRAALIIASLCFAAATGNVVAQQADENPAPDADADNDGRATLPDEAARLQDWAQHIRSDEVTWLGDEGSMLGWYRPALDAGDQPMALLLLLDRPTSLQQQLTSSALYEYLPEHGYAALAIAMAEFPPTAIPARTQAAANTSEDDNGDDEDSGNAGDNGGTSSEDNDGNNTEATITDDPAQEAFAATLTTQLAAALDMLRQRGNDDVVVAVGKRYADKMLPLLADRSAELRGMLLINVDSGVLDAQQRGGALEKFPDEQFAIFDLYERTARQSFVGAVDPRKRIFRLAGFKENYRSISLDNADSPEQALYTARRVRAWLNSLKQLPRQ